MTRTLSNRIALGVVALVSALVLLLAVNVLTGELLPGARLDLTQERLYTLSPGTKQILASLDEPITFRFFFSDRLARELPQYATYSQQVRNLLNEYASRSNGKLKVESYNPEPFSDTEDRAVAYGLKGVPVDQSGEQVYFGLVGTNTTDDVETIPFFQTERERFLEYDLTRMVNKLAHPKQPVVGLLSSLPMAGDPMSPGPGGQPSPWTIYDQISQAFTVNTLAADVAEIPSDVDVLMLVHPASLSDKTRYAIDQYVLRGGKALVFVDPYAEGAAFRLRAAMARGMMQGVTSPKSDMPDLLQAWGVKLDPDVIAGDRKNARRVSTGGPRAQAADYLPWITLPADSMDHADAVTGQLQTITMASAGVLEPVDGATTKMEPLIQTSSQSMKVPADKVSGTPDILGLLRGFKSEGKPLTVAARVTGPAKTAFPDGPPKEEKKDEAKGDEKKDEAKAADEKKDEPAAGAADKPDDKAAPQLTESTGPINVILVADSDMLEDRFWVNVQDFFGQRVVVPTANNGDFVINALDNLTGSSALIGLRSRNDADRPFTVVRAMQQEASSRYSEKEQQLQDQLKDTQKKLSDLRTGADSKTGQVVLTAEQSKEIEGFQAQLLKTRAQLRDVQRSLKEGINRLQAQVQFLDIALVPLLIAIVAIVVGFMRLRYRRQAV
jgi:ABC-type uncharacterized transport system involved in gliding motility auxiliary subunit